MNTFIIISCKIIPGIAVHDISSEFAVHPVPFIVIPVYRANHPG